MTTNVCKIRVLNSPIHPGLFSYLRRQPGAVNCKGRASNVHPEKEVVDELVQSESGMQALRVGAKRKGREGFEDICAKRRALDNRAFGHGEVHETPRGPESEAMAGDAGDSIPHAVSLLSEGARRLACFANNVQLITRGEALLVRLVLQEAISNAATYKWATRSEGEISAFFRGQRSVISTMIADKKRRAEPFSLMDLTDAEQQRLIKDAMDC